MKQLIFLGGILLAIFVISVPNGAGAGNKSSVWEEGSITRPNKKILIKGQSFAARVDGGAHLKKRMDSGQFKMKGVDSERNTEGYGAKYNMKTKDLNVKSLDEGRMQVQEKLDAGKIQIQEKMDSREETKDYKPVDVLKLDEREKTENYEPIDPFELDDDKLQMTH